MFFFPFICSSIPGLALGILKMLTQVCFCDALQTADCFLFLASYESQPVSKINVQYLQ